MSSLKGLVTIGKNFVMANRPEILFGASVTGTLGAVVMAAKGGYDAGQKIMRIEHAIDEDAERDIELTLKEKAQETWTCYLPAAGLTVGTLAATSGLHLVHVQDKKALAQAAMAAAAEVKEQAAAYEMSASEQNKVKDKVLTEAADENGVAKVMTTDGIVEDVYLVRDAKTGRDIWSNKVIVEGAMNMVNQQLLRNGDCDLNTFYSYAGFDLLPDGDDWGWSGEPAEISWSATTRSDGTPVAVFTFHQEPDKSYDRRC